MYDQKLLQSPIQHLLIVPRLRGVEGLAAEELEIGLIEVRHGQLPRAEGLILQLQLAVGSIVAVLAVAEDGAADAGHVGADLVGAAGDEPHLQQGQTARDGDGLILGLHILRAGLLVLHDLDDAAVGVLEQIAVEGGDRVGIYYLETGASMRPSKVIYDRAHSAIAEADPCDFDFDAIMEGADWFHWSGITPAISDKAAELTKLACEAAKRHGVTVSVDLNFRKKLWTKEKAQSIMKPLMQYVDVCIGNEEDAELCLGFKPEANVEAGETNAEGYKGIFKAMAKEFGFKYVVSTLRESFSATHNGWKAMIYNGEEFYESKRYDINPIIDRVGGGDSFSGGIIHGLLTKPNQGAALEFAVAASALKHTINGDFNLVSVDEVEALAGGDASGRVQR